jgi:hypothetical protein
MTLLRPISGTPCPTVYAPDFRRWSVSLSQVSTQGSKAAKSSQPVAHATFSYSGGSMRIRQLAGNAAVITAAATAMLGFSTGIAGATPAIQATPATPATKAIPAMQFCNSGFVCTYGLSPRVGIYFLESFRCVNTTYRVLQGDANLIYQVTNRCSTRVWLHSSTNSPQCVSPNTTSGGVGRFVNIVNLQVTLNRNRC